VLSVDDLRSVGAAAFEPAAQLFDGGRHDEDSAGIIAENTPEVQSSDDVDIKNDDVSVGPDAFDFTAQGSVAGAFVDLLPLDELVFGYSLHEFLLREEIVVFAVLFATARGTAGGRNGKFELRVTFQ